MILHRLSRAVRLLSLFSAILAFTGCSPRADIDRNVTFTVLVKTSARGDKVYLTGGGSQLGDWNPSALLMTQVSDSVWTKTLRFRDGEKIEYKITAGSWPTQALDSNRMIYDNFQLKVRSDTSVIIKVYDWLTRMSNGIPIFNEKNFRPGLPALALSGPWRFHTGDSAAWALQTYNDSTWKMMEPSLDANDPSKWHWENIGWFRYHFYTDTSLWGKTVGMTIRHMGASELYYNGRPLYTFGHIGPEASSTLPYRNRLWKEFRIDPRYDQLIAVRYANYDWRNELSEGYDPGFVINVSDLNTVIQSTVQSARSDAISEAVFALIPLILSFLHLFLYSFYPKQKQNLFYAICLLGFSAITYFNYEWLVTTSPENAVVFTRLITLSAGVAIFFGLLTIYSITYARLPKRWWLFLILFLAVCALAFYRIQTNTKGLVVYIYFGFSTIDGIVASIQNKMARKGNWLILAGYIILNAFILVQILVDYRIIPYFGYDRLYIFGMLSLAASMSVYLAYNFSWINKDLEFQLNNVRSLSEKALEQERLAGRLEIERRTVEMENERKSRELESARDLQLSLLPKEIPRPEGFDIACYMKTASEVGGDYYDFLGTGQDGMALIMGDATGHGLKAGNMVITTKGLLNTFAGTEEPDEILRAVNRAIKKMNLHMLTMCLAITRITGKKLSYSSAGMPPLLIYRKETRSAAPLVLKAMPLGAVHDFPYSRLTATLSPGDVIVMVSDGMIEIFNEIQETFGLERIVTCVQSNADKDARGIVQALLDEGVRWAGTTPLVDDQTMVVVKVIR